MSSWLKNPGKNQEIFQNRALLYCFFNKRYFVYYKDKFVFDYGYFLYYKAKFTVDYVKL